MKINILLLSIIISACQFKNNNNHIIITKLEENKNEWKKLAICLCVYETTPFTNEMKRNDGSAGGYLQMNSIFDLDDFKKTQNFVNKYLKKTEYNSKTNRSLSLKKCLDFYESKDLDDFINKLKAR